MMLPTTLLMISFLTVSAQQRTTISLDVSFPRPSFRRFLQQSFDVSPGRVECNYIHNQYRTGECTAWALNTYERKKIGAASFQLDQKRLDGFKVLHLIRLDNLSNPRSYKYQRMKRYYKVGYYILMALFMMAKKLGDVEKIELYPESSGVRQYYRRLGFVGDDVLELRVNNASIFQKELNDLSSHLKLIADKDDDVIPDAMPIQQHVHL